MESLVTDSDSREYLLQGGSVCVLICWGSHWFMSGLWQGYGMIILPLPGSNLPRSQHQVSSGKGSVGTESWLEGMGGKRQPTPSAPCRFWEAVLLPCAVVVAFPACLAT